MELIDNVLEAIIEAISLLGLVALTLFLALRIPKQELARTSR
jgi:hypothetical protein